MTHHHEDDAIIAASELQRRGLRSIVDRMATIAAMSDALTAMASAPSWLTWPAARDPVVARHFGPRFFDDLGARIVAGALADLFLFNYEAAVVARRADLAALYSDAEGELRAMAHGEDE